MYEYCTTHQIELRIFVGVALLLLAFGIVYNWLVAWLERKGYERGITAFLVAIGCSVVLLGVWQIYGWDVALGSIFLFAAAGIPMIAGATKRYLDTRDEESQLLFEALKGLFGQDDNQQQAAKEQ